MHDVKQNQTKSGVGKPWVEIEAFLSDVFATFLAKSESAFINAPKCCIDSCATRHAPAHCRVRHGLALQGVHATEPANRLLVERDRGTVLGRGGVLVGKLCAFRQKGVAISL